MTNISGTVTCLILTLCVSLSVQISVDEYVTITLRQKFLLDEFRHRVIDRVPHDFMREESYLIRWLRDKDYNVDAAEKQLLNHVSWRENTQMDSILEEDWSEYDDELKFNIEGCDLDGKWVASLRLGEWDVRKYVVSGKTKTLMRFVDKIYEEAQRLIVAMQKEGQNATQLTLLMNLDNFNLIEQGCGQCIPVMLRVITTYESQYVGLIHKIVLLNAPQIALPIWELARNFVSPKTKEIMYLFGKKKSEWNSFLLNEISQNQLSRSFGGTKQHALDFQELRDTGEIYSCNNRALG